MSSTTKLLQAIDVGSTKITCIVGQYFQPENKLNIIAVASQPSLGFKKGQIVDLEAASKSIAQSVLSCERMIGAKIKSPVIGITGTHLECLSGQASVAVTNSEINQQDINRVTEASKNIALNLNQEILHFLPKKYLVDDQDGIQDPLGMSGSKLAVETLFILANKAYLQNLEKSLTLCQIQPKQFVYNGISASFSLNSTEKELGSVLIDIGGSQTTVTVFFESAPIYSFVVPMGGSHITNDLAIGLRLPIPQAEQLKTKLTKVLENNTDTEEVGSELFELDLATNTKFSLQTITNGIIKPRLEELFGYIRNQIEENNLSQVIPAGIVLTGGGSLTWQAKEVAQRILHTSVRVAIPEKIGGLTDDILSPAYTSTVGLLFYQLQPEKIHKPTSKSKIPQVSFLPTLLRLKKLIEPLLP